MRRLHLVELEDQPWLPPVLRDLATDYLALLGRIVGLPTRARPLLHRLLAVAPEPRVVDLASGAGGPLTTLAAALVRDGVEVVLTDAYPNVPTLARLAREAGARLEPRPVDARAVPADLRGARTVFLAFHHFAPPEARRLLADAVHAGAPIGIFELAERRLLTLALMPLVAAGTWLVAPFQRPRRAQRLLWTYLLPLVPLLVFFDGVVSCLRCYTPAELLALGREVEAPGWRWEAGRVRLGLPMAHLTYLLGSPPERRPSAVD